MANRPLQKLSSTLKDYCHRRHQKSTANVNVNVNMKRIAQLPFGDGSALMKSCLRTQQCLYATRTIANSLPATQRPFTRRCIHTTTIKEATASENNIAGPPPPPPVPSAEHVDSRVARRRKQAELLKRGQDLRAIAGGKGSGTAKTKRFWKDVHVNHAEGMLISIPTGTLLKVF